MAIKLIKINTNGTQETYSGSTTSSGTSSSGEFIATNSSGKIDISFLPPGIGEDAIIAIAGESLSSGDMVYIDNLGKVFKADATTIAKQARGYVTESFASGVNAKVFFDDSNSFLTGLTPGATYFLSASTPGKVTTTPPTTSGTIIQEVGFASSATNLRVNIQEPIIN